MTLKRTFFLFLYYGFARFFPPTNSCYIGRIGGKLRNTCARHLFKKCGNNINIEFMADFGKGNNIEIGNNSGIGIHCHVPNNIYIGDNVMMGPYVYFLDNITHQFNRTDIPIIQQGHKVIKTRTIIENDVWIGRQCIIGGGKRIGNHSIIGAGSVVFKDIPSSVIAVGNPVRIIKNR